MVFKVCPACRHEWPTAADFERESRTTPVGIVVDFEDPWETLVLFTDTCGTTLALRAEELRERLPCLGAAALLAGEPPCPRHCLRFENLETCPNVCRNAPVRNYVVGIMHRRARARDRSAA